MVFPKKYLIFAFILLLNALLPERVQAEENAKKAEKTETPGHAVTNPMAGLNEAERDYYNQSFSYAMQTMKLDQVYEWRTTTSYGSIRAGKTFLSKSKTRCRSFSETFEIHGKVGELQGYGCKRDERDGWCKLREGNMLNCALEPPDNIIDKVIDGASKAKGNANTRILTAEYNFWSWWPF